ncbi:MAG: hypothetical protein C4315_04470 [Chloroflexota bacterium]
MPGPLEGVKVLEIANWVAGPSACAILSELGADVIKVEPPETGDAMRSITTSRRGVVPYTGGVNVAIEQDNRGKRSIAVDLSRPEGQEVVHRLAARSDVLVTNLIPQRRERYRLRYEDLAPQNPRLIYVALTGYGPEGPDRDRPGFDYAAFWARSGIMATLGEPDAPPVQQRPGMGDHTTSLAIVSAVAVALYEREKSGLGQQVDCALFHTGLWVLSMDVVAALKERAAVERVSRKEVTNPLFNYYRTADGKWIQLVMPVSDPFWPGVCRALGLAELIDDPRFSSHGRRMENCRELIKIFEERFLSLPRAEWGERLDAEGCIWAPVQTLDEVIEDPQAHANGYFVTLKHPSGEDYQVVAAPLKFRRTPGQVKGPAPEVGQDTELILLELGYEWDQIERLKADRVII